MVELKKTITTTHNFFPVERNTYELLYKVSKKGQRYITKFIKRNPKLNGKITEEFIIIKGVKIYWKTMLDIIEVDNAIAPKGIDNYLRRKVCGASQGLSVGDSYYWDYLNGYWNYFGIGINDTLSAWQNILKFSNNPKYVLIYVTNIPRPNQRNKAESST